MYWSHTFILHVCIIEFLYGHTSFMVFLSLSLSLSLSLFPSPNHVNVGYNNTMIWRPSYIDIVFHMHNYCMAQIEVSRARGCKKEEGYIIIHNLTVKLTLIIITCIWCQLMLLRAVHILCVRRMATLLTALSRFSFPPLE